MARIAGVGVPGLPHHVTQCGNRRERVFFEDGDDALYRDWLGESCRRSELIGRPLGSAGFAEEIEKRLGRALAGAPRDAPHAPVFISGRKREESPPPSATGGAADRTAGGAADRTTGGAADRTASSDGAGAVVAAGDVAVVVAARGTGARAGAVTAPRGRSE